MISFKDYFFVNSNFHATSKTPGIILAALTKGSISSMSFPNLLIMVNRRALQIPASSPGKKPST